MLLSHTLAPFIHPKRTARRHSVAAGLVSLGTLLATSAHAHEGHGIASNMHWHATDVLGFVVAAIAVVALVWWTRK